MSQVLSVKVGKDLTDEAMSRLLAKWTEVGTATPAEYGYRLVSDNEEVALVTAEDGEIVLQGQFGERALSIIESLARSFDTELLFEGEPLAAGEDPSKWGSLGFFAKFLSILIGVIILPAALVALPVILLYSLLRLVFKFFVMTRR